MSEQEWVQAMWWLGLLTGVGVVLVVGGLVRESLLRARPLWWALRGRPAAAKRFGELLGREDLK